MVCVAGDPHVYETSFVLPVLMLAIVLAAAPGERPARLLTGVACVLAVALPVSIALVAGLYGPSLVRTFSTSGNLKDQPHSLAVLGYAGERRRILAAARQCGLDPMRWQGNLLVDEATYLAFMASPRPQHYLSVLSIEGRGKIDDPITYLRSRGSAGVILDCKHLPADLLRRARREGDYCCLAPPSW